MYTTITARLGMAVSAACYRKRTQHAPACSISCLQFRFCYWSSPGHRALCPTSRPPAPSWQSLVHQQALVGRRPSLTALTQRQVWMSLEESAQHESPAVDRVLGLLRPALLCRPLARLCKATALPGATAFGRLLAHALPWPGPAERCRAPLQHPLLAGCRLLDPALARLRPQGPHKAGLLLSAPAAHRPPARAVAWPCLAEEERVPRQHVALTAQSL